MARAKHTPGPWSVYDGLGKTLAVCIGEEPNGKRPCIVDWPGFDSCDLPFSQQRANAHLIAAAPDMLAALKDIVRWAERNNRWDKSEWREVYAAITKATAA